MLFSTAISCCQAHNEAKASVKRAIKTFSAGSKQLVNSRSAHAKAVSRYRRLLAFALLRRSESFRREVFECCPPHMGKSIIPSVTLLLASDAIS